jgi:hypothetical protein
MIRRIAAWLNAMFAENADGTRFVRDGDDLKLLRTEAVKGSGEMDRSKYRVPGSLVDFGRG